jgi:hypothetical protein
MDDASFVIDHIPMPVGMSHDGPFVNDAFMDRPFMDRSFVNDSLVVNHFLHGRCAPHRLRSSSTTSGWYAAFASGRLAGPFHRGSVGCRAHCSSSGFIGGRLLSERPSGRGE